MRKSSVKPSKKSRVELPCAPESTVVNPALTSIFTYCFYKSAYRLREFLHRELEPLGLIGPHVGVLKLLNAQGALSQNDLCEQMSIDKATMVKFIDHLEKKKLVNRRPDKVDRRVKYIEITRQGRSILTTTQRLREKTEEKFLSILTEEERTVLLRAIPKLLISEF